MPIRYWIFKDEKLNVIQHIGVTDRADQFAYIEATDADPEYCINQDVLVDLSQLSTTSMSSKDVMDFSRRVGQRRHTAERVSKHAIVAPSPHAYGIARMYSGYTDIVENTELEIFETPEQALEWLGREQPADQFLQRSQWKYANRPAVKAQLMDSEDC